MTTVLRCGTLLDGTGGPPIHDGTIVIEARRIAAIARASDPLPDSATTGLDLSLKFVMPGLVDAQSHASIVPVDGDQMRQMRQPAVR